MVHAEVEENEHLMALGGVRSSIWIEGGHEIEESEQL